MSGRVAYSWIVPRPTFGNSTGRALRVVSSPIVELEVAAGGVDDVAVGRDRDLLAGRTLGGHEADALAVGVGLQLAGVAAAARAAHGHRAERRGVPPRNEIVVFSPAVSVPGTG